MKKALPPVPPSSDDFDAAVDVLALMLSQNATRSFLAQPNLRVREIRDPETGRLMYSFRSPEDEAFGESATPEA